MFEHQRNGQFSGTYGVTSYGSGCEKHVVDQCLELLNQVHYPETMEKAVGGEEKGCLSLEVILDSNPQTSRSRVR